MQNQIAPSVTSIERRDFLSIQNGEKAQLPFSDSEYHSRLKNLRQLMLERSVDVAVFTSMHNVAYYSGFLYCAFGRPYACVVTQSECVTISANIDYGQPWRRSIEDNLVYTDWRRDNYWRALEHVAGRGRVVGIESDHMTLQLRQQMDEFLAPKKVVDLSSDCMSQRMVKSGEEISLIKEGARIADIGGAAIKEAIGVGVREIDVAMAGRDAMELAISEALPDAEYRDTWVWFQSGLNTDGAHNPVTSRKIESGDILSLNAFPMISGYYTALERTLFAETIDSDSLGYWQANVQAHELGLSLIKPGVSCADICQQLNGFFAENDLLQYRTFGYGHSFGVLSHYYGREAGLEIREDIDTELVPGMVVSIEPMLTVPQGQPGAGGYREHDILVVTESGAENITGFPYGPEHLIVQ